MKKKYISFGSLILKTVSHQRESWSTQRSVKVLFYSSVLMKIENKHKE